MTLANNITCSNIITEMKNQLTNSSSRPTVLYGAGRAAGYIHDFLAENSIHIDLIAVDDNCPAPEAFKGKKVATMKEVAGKHNSVNMIIGYYVNGLTNNVKKKREELRRAGLDIANLYMIDYSLAMRPERIFSCQFVCDNIDKFEWLYNILDDEKSKAVLTAYLNQRISMRIGELDQVLDENQYFINSLIKLGKKEIYVDCGAYDGDTVESFLKELKAQNGEYDAIYALELDESNYRDLCKNCQHLNNFFPVNKGAYSFEGEMRYMSNRKTSSQLMESGEETARVTTIDNILSGKKATLIKMDIQGAELKALKGAEKTIKNHSPKLSICVYHNKDDLWTIPRYLNSITSIYKFHLRAHQSRAGEIVLYCIPS